MVGNQNVPFYPSRAYLDRNWAPEHLPRPALAALAQAQSTAQKEGILPPALAQQMLPMALVEGWPESFGVVDGRYGYPANPRRDELVRRMGFTIANSDDPRLIKKWAQVHRDTRDGYQINPMMQTERGYTQMAARMVPLILAEKARLYGEGKAVERFNGRGRAVEEVYGDTVQADSANHARKVAEAGRMLKNPANAHIAALYRGLLED